MTLEKLFRPRKAQKTLNKSIYCVGLAIHPQGSNLSFDISLIIFVLFVFFVDKLRFLL